LQHSTVRMCVRACVVSFGEAGGEGYILAAQQHPMGQQPMPGPGGLHLLLINTPQCHFSEAVAHRVVAALQTGCDSIVYLYRSTVHYSTVLPGIVYCIAVLARHVACSCYAYVLHPSCHRVRQYITTVPQYSTVLPLCTVYACPRTSRGVFLQWLCLAFIMLSNQTGNATVPQYSTVPAMSLGMFLGVFMFCLLLAQHCTSLLVELNGTYVTRT